MYQLNNAKSTFNTVLYDSFANDIFSNAMLLSLYCSTTLGIREITLSRMFRNGKYIGRRTRLMNSR